MITPSNSGRLFSVLGLAAALATVFASASVANAQASFAILQSFIGTDGAIPSAALIQGPDGTLYGTTVEGGTNGLGTVFQMAPDGSGFRVLHSFTGPPTDGVNPYASLIQGPDGTLYGTTSQGGTSALGTIFQLAADGSGFTVLRNFTGSPTDGAYPNAALIQGPDGTIYGTTGSGGTNYFGTVFQIAPDGSGYAVLHLFTGSPTDGAYPNAALIQGPDGTLYGTTAGGGTFNMGAVFQMAQDGSGYSILHSFTLADGYNPYV